MKQLIFICISLILRRLSRFLRIFTLDTWGKRKTYLLLQKSTYESLLRSKGNACLIRHGDTNTPQEAFSKIKYPESV